MVDSSTGHMYECPYLYHVNYNKNIKKKKKILIIVYKNFYAGVPWDMKIISMVPQGQEGWNSAFDLTEIVVFPHKTTAAVTMCDNEKW